MKTIVMPTWLQGYTAPRLRLDFVAGLSLAVLVVILLVGGVYYALVQHRRPAHRMAPEGELPESQPVMTT